VANAVVVMELAVSWNEKIGMIIEALAVIAWKHRNRGGKAYAPDLYSNTTNGNPAEQSLCCNPVCGFSPLNRMPRSSATPDSSQYVGAPFPADNRNHVIEDIEDAVMQLGIPKNC
jgi:hypothetical protein